MQFVRIVFRGFMMLRDILGARMELGSRGRIWKTGLRRRGRRLDLGWYGKGGRKRSGGLHIVHFVSFVALLNNTL